MQQKHFPSVAEHLTPAGFLGGPLTSGVIGGSRMASTPYR